MHNLGKAAQVIPKKSKLPQCLTADPRGSKLREILDHYTNHPALTRIHSRAIQEHSYLHEVNLLPYSYLPSRRHTLLRPVTLILCDQCFQQVGNCSLTPMVSFNKHETQELRKWQLIPGHKRQTFNMERERMKVMPVTGIWLGDQQSGSCGGGDSRQLLIRQHLSI